MEPAPRWWLRAYLLFAAFQGLALGITGLVVPDQIQVPLRMTPLNERFVAALYFAGGLGVLLAAFSRRRSEARLFVLGFGFATGIILILTLLHWGDFMADPLPNRSSWIAAYVLDPLFALAIVPAAGYLRLPARVAHPLTRLLLIEAILTGALAVVLLFAPTLAAAYWPWALPPVVGQLYACFFLTFAVGAFLAAGEAETAAIRNFLVSSLALCLGVLLASLLHLGRFKPEPVTWLWFALFGIGAAAFAVALVVQWRSAGGARLATATQAGG